MHADVVDTETPLIGGEDNDERFTNESNLRARWLRAQALVDLPDVPLFFGRLDYDAGDRPRNAPGTGSTSGAGTSATRRVRRWCRLAGAGLGAVLPRHP